MAQTTQSFEGTEMSDKENVHPLKGDTHTLKQAVQNVGPIAKKAYQATEKAIGNAIESTESTIKRYPAESLLVGFGLGCAVGWLIRRK